MKIILTYLLVLTGLATAAQEGRPMTLQECIDYALKNNELITNAALEKDIAETQVKEALSTGLPQVNGNVGFVKNIDIQTSFIQDFISPAVYGVLKDEDLIPDNATVPEPQTFPAAFGTDYSGQASIGVSQLIFNGSYFVGSKAARTVKVLSEKQLKQTEVEVVQNVMNAYYLTLITKANLEFLATNFGTIDTLFNETSAMYENGFAEKIDVSRIQIQRNNLKTSLANNTDLLVTAVSLLKFQMGMPMSENITPSGDLNDVQLEALELGDNSNAFQDRPEYEVLVTNKDLIELNIKNFKSQYF